MIIAKSIDGRIFEIKNCGTVQFDKRDGWLLVCDPGDSRMMNLRWIHPDDVKLEWILEFRFWFYAFSCVLYLST